MFRSCEKNWFAEFSKKCNRIWEELPCRREVGLPIF